MFRLIRTLILIVSAVFAALIGIGLLIGQIMPVGEQVVFTQSRPDQWTQISLVELDRKLAANRFLPIRTNSAQWSGDGKRLIVSGVRNDRSRVYALHFSPESKATRWLTTMSQQNAYNPYSTYSPDMRWTVVTDYREDGRDFTVALEPLDTGKTVEYLQPFNIPVDAESYMIMGMSFWTPDSRFFIYSKIKQVNRYTNAPPPPQTSYYIIDTETGEERLLTEEGMPNDLQISPDGKHILYSVPKARQFPSESIEDYQLRYVYYLHDLESGERFPVSDKGFNQIAWSMDSKKLAYLTYSEMPEVSQPTNPVERILTGNRGYLYSSPSYFSSYYSSMPIHPGGMMMNYSRMGGGITMMGNASLSAFMVDVETGEQVPINTEGFGNAYGFQWLPDMSGLMFTVQRMGIQGLVAQALRMPVYTPPARTETFVWRFNQTEPQVLKYEDKDLMTMQAAPKGDQVLMAVIPPQSSMGYQNPNELYLYRAASGEISPIDLQGDQYMFPNWSPDGQHLVIVTQTTASSQNLPGNALGAPTLVPGAPLPTIAPFATPTIFPTTGAPVLMMGAVMPPPPMPMFRLYLINGMTGESRVLTSTNEPNMLFWSSDSKSAMYYDTQMGGRRVLYLIEDMSLPDALPQPVWVTSGTRYGYGSFPIWRPREGDAPVRPLGQKG
jgi:Tol biopolymer transport system component